MSVVETGPRTGGGPPDSEPRKTKSRDPEVPSVLKKRGSVKVWCVLPHLLPVGEDSFVENRHPDPRGS